MLRRRCSTVAWKRRSPGDPPAKPLTKKQLRAIDLRADGNSWEQVARQLDVSERTVREWRTHPDWQPTFEARCDDWIAEYQHRFKRMMPKAAYTHDKLLDSQNEAIRMRAVDSCHANYARCIQQEETKSEVEELRDIVRMLLDTLAQQQNAH
jgi:hypothetical protein